MPLNLTGKKVIAIGERDGVQGEAIARIVQSAGAEVLLQITQCFVWTAAGAMDLEEQERIKQTVAAHGADDVVVILGSPDAESAEMFAETVSSGDPTYAGALAGVSLGLPVYHATEPEVKAAVDPETYADQVELMELVLDLDAIHRAVRSVRERAAEASTAT